jgi:hypothetical protein
MVPITRRDVIESFATRDIVAGEEITLCYNTDFECRTRRERHQALGFACNCQACLEGTPFQKLSDMRRRLIRGVEYLANGVDIDGQRQSLGSPIITDPRLKLAAETLSIPLSSRLIYRLLAAALLEEEGLLDDFMVGRVSPGIQTMATLFRTKSNAGIASIAMAQETWRERFLVAFQLFG